MKGHTTNVKRKTRPLGDRQLAVLFLLDFWGKWIAHGYPSWHYINRSNTQKIMHTLEARGLVESNDTMYTLTYLGVVTVSSMKANRRANLPTE